MDTILKVEDLHIEIKTRLGTVRAANGVDFEIQAGDRLGIVGESGSGKSMTSLAIMGLLPKRIARVSQGQISFLGNSLLDLSREKLRDLRGKDIAMVFQNPMSSLNPFLTIETQLIEGYVTHFGASRGKARARAVDILGQVGIPDPQKRLKSYPHELSGGMRQRVMIAIGLMCEPKLLIADEPTSALDVTIQAQILKLLEELQNRLKMTVMLITHDIGLVAEYCNKVAVMYAGRIVEMGTVDQLFYAPKHPYTIGLLNSVPSLHLNQKDPLKPILGSPPDLTQEIKGCPFYPRCDFRRDACLDGDPPERISDAGQRFRCIENVSYEPPARLNRERN